MKTHPSPARTPSRKDHSSAPAGAAPVPPIDPRWAWHYRTLLRLRDRLARDTETKLHESATPVEAHSMHPADSATDEFEHDVALTLLAAEENALTDVNDAIGRILQGRYGICEATGEKIPARRLHALPWCRYARDVEQRLERSGEVPKLRLPGLVSIRPENTAAVDSAPEVSEQEPEESEEPEESKESAAVAERATPKIGEIEPLLPRDAQAQTPRHPSPSPDHPSRSGKPC